MSKRNKYNYEFRLQCVELVLKEHRSIISVATEKGFNPSNLRLWIMFYKQYGQSGLQQRTKQCYEVSFKLKVLETINKECLSLLTACVRFNIPTESVIIGWQREYESKGLSGLLAQPKGGSKKMQHPIKRKSRKSSAPLTDYQKLLLENERLKAENELLKKLQALTQTSKKHKS
ncbi:transposase [Emticicia sp. BO119]|uniref:transposase n=1 Tax=Emticicia sp. BO119 TaxID=2757768 RepID=UPI0015EFE734|nr:transposase [Emticicia sp. BO119]MBA4851547.1 transposase [Emticicia sp. BO119]